VLVLVNTQNTGKMYKICSLLYHLPVYQMCLTSGSLAVINLSLKVNIVCYAVTKLSAVGTYDLTVTANYLQPDVPLNAT
jgi:hypothetical protein